jgi:hypothetical protein
MEVNACILTTHMVNKKLHWIANFCTISEGKKLELFLSRQFPKKWLKYFLRPSDITRPNLGLFYHTIFKGSDLARWSLQ